MLVLNCDLGELVGENNNDALIMPLIDQANIACGAHAGSYDTMLETVKLAVKHNVSIGAHPSYPDRENFGRISMKMKRGDLKASLLSQINELKHICIEQNTCLDYVKPHGALYNDMMVNLDIFETICQALSIDHSNLALMMQALPNTHQFKAIAEKYNISLLFEAFADRSYQSNGLLVPRSERNSVLNQQNEVIKRIYQLIKYQQLTSIDNQILPLNADTLCVHGDNNAALELTSALRKLINESV